MTYASLQAFWTSSRRQSRGRRARNEREGADLGAVGEGPVVEFVLDDAAGRLVERLGRDGKDGVVDVGAASHLVVDAGRGLGVAKGGQGEEGERHEADEEGKDVHGEQIENWNSESERE